MSIVHNLLRLFEAKLKSEEGIQDTKVINAWQKDFADNSAPSCGPTFERLDDRVLPSRNVRPRTFRDEIQDSKSDLT